MRAAAQDWEALHKGIETLTVGFDIKAVRRHYLKLHMALEMLHRSGCEFFEQRREIRACQCFATLAQLRFFVPQRLVVIMHLQCMENGHPRLAVGKWPGAKDPEFEQ
ncbi:hypothetical protein D3C72_1247230 [compost metagenome]